MRWKNNRYGMILVLRLKLVFLISLAPLLLIMLMNYLPVLYQNSLSLFNTAYGCFLYQDKTFCLR